MPRFAHRAPVLHSRKKVLFPFFPWHTAFFVFPRGKWTYSEAEGADYSVTNQISIQDVKRTGNVPESSSVGFSCDCIGEKMARDSPANHKPKLLLIILLYL